jgi:citronellol/citronellal dehydrogenase
MSVAGKVAIVTGSSRGVGHYIARELARAGANVVIAARTEKEGDSRLPGSIASVAAECRGFGVEALPLHLDLTDDQSVHACVEKAMAEMGKIDLLVNNAGVMAAGALHEVPMKRIDLVFGINVRGAWIMSREVIPHMLAVGSGVIVNISSIGADHAGAGNVSYSVTKLADRKIAEGIAAEYLDRGIRAYSLSPERLVLTPGAEMQGLAQRVPPEHIEPPELMGQAVIALFDDIEGKYNGRHVFSGPLVRELQAASS